jgi:hypothetical protein
MLSMPRIVRPDRSRLRANEIGSPIDPATRRVIKRNKELPEACGRNFVLSNTAPVTTTPALQPANAQMML